MKRFLFILSLAACAAIVAACGALNPLNPLSGGGDDLKAVGSLWSDVPAMEGLGKSPEAELPSFIRLFMRTGVNLMMKGLGEDSPQWDWIMFSTSKTPGDIQNFYTPARMASPPYNWTSDQSGCMSGEQALAPGSALCIFTKEQNGKQTGLLIITAQDESNQETNVFFLRGESDAAPAASGANPGANQQPTQGAMTMLNGPAPYGIEKRPMPSGLDLDQLLPKQVGPYTRTSIELAGQPNAQPVVKIDGDSLYAHYRSGGTEIFVEFAVTSSAADAQAILDVAAGETTDRFPTDPRFGSMGTEPSYLKVNNESGAFFAWTRGGYYFSANANSGEADLDAFMQAFPY